VRDGCPHCADAKLYLSELVKTRPGLDVVYRSVDHDAAARADLVRLSREAGVWPPGVPTFVVAGLLVGFTDAATTGRAQRVDQCRTATGQVETTLFGTLSVRARPAALHRGIGLLDDFNRAP
jgi:hypothetical protein